MKLTKKEIANLIAEKLYNPTKNKTDYAFQLFIESAVLPDDCNDYDDKKLVKYLMDFMG